MTKDETRDLINRIDALSTDLLELQKSSDELIGEINEIGSLISDVKNKMVDLNYILLKSIRTKSE